MTMRLFTTAEKLGVVEAMIEDMRRQASGDDDFERLAVLRSVASDLRARFAGAPSAALAELERRMAAVARAKNEHRHDGTAVLGLGQELVSRWAVVKQALERFGESVDGGRDAVG